MIEVIVQADSLQRCDHRLTVFRQDVKVEILGIPELAGVNGGGEGATWYTVAGIDSPNQLMLVGHMGPPFGGPLATLLRLALNVPAEQLLSVIRQRHSLRRH